MMVPVCNLVTLNYVNALNHHNIYQKGWHDGFQPNPELFKTTSSFFRMTILMFILPSKQKPILEVPVGYIWIYITLHMFKSCTISHGHMFEPCKEKKTHPPLSPFVYHIFTSHVFCSPSPTTKKNPPVFHTALVSQGTLHGGFPQRNGCRRGGRSTSCWAFPHPPGFQSASWACAEKKEAPSVVVG